MLCCLVLVWSITLGCIHAEHFLFLSSMSLCESAEQAASSLAVDQTRAARLSWCRGLVRTSITAIPDQIELVNLIQINREKKKAKDSVEFVF